MSDYSTKVAKIIHQAQSREDALPVKNEHCRSKFFFHPHPTSKIFILFHGFTAGSYQFEPLGKALFEAGYNVLIPLQPGHGYAGNWSLFNPPPLPTDIRVYQKFALSWVEVATTLGEQLIVGGLSTGGTLAGWLALERPQEIARALLFAPFISSSNKIIDFLVQIIPFYFEWLNKDNPGNFGYDGFRIPAARILLNLGKKVLDRVQNSPTVPMFVISSASDRLSNHKDEWALFKAVVKSEPKSWFFCFKEELKIPHTMMTELEGNNYLNLLINVVKAYLESDLTWSEVREIGYQMLHGKTFDIAVQELNLTERVSQNLSMMLAVMEQKMFIDAHK